MHIALVTSDYLHEIGGISQHVENLSRALAREHQVSVLYLARRGVASDAVDPHGRRLIVLPQGITRWQRWQSHWRHPVSRELARLAPDIVHIHTLFDAFLYRGLNFPAVYTNHCSAYLKLHQQWAFRNWILPKMLSRFDGVICPSAELAAKSEHEAVTMIPNGVDLERFSLEKREHWDRQSYLASTYGIHWRGEQVLLSTRRLVPKNGVLDFVQANVNYFVEHRDDLLYLIAGDGEEAEPLRQLIESRQLTNVRMLGAVPHKAIDGLYYSADYSILPSKMEAISITALEAMAAGAIVVATRVGGLGELVTPGVNGLALPASLDLTGPLRQTSPERSEQLRIAASELVRQKYSWESMVRQTVQVYDRVLNQSRRSARAIAATSQSLASASSVRGL